MYKFKSNAYKKSSTTGFKSKIVSYKNITLHQSNGMIYQSNISFGKVSEVSESIFTFNGNSDFVVLVGCCSWTQEDNIMTTLLSNINHYWKIITIPTKIPATSEFNQENILSEIGVLPHWYRAEHLPYVIFKYSNVICKILNTERMLIK